MKKIILSALCVGVLALVGCNNTEANKSEETKKTQETKKINQEEKFIEQTKNISGLNITIKGLEKVEGNQNGKEQKIIKISAHLKNTTADPLGYDSLGMEIFNKDGKKLEWYPSTNFGGTLDPQEDTNGDSFYVSEGEGPYKIIYTDLDKPENKATWTNLPGSK
ncbi:DUF4352 domain-containing protein [Listeria booriae]|uniref:DUF4352 domain-containing protein n=1 Tax=Listeria booriae TaxID=1552123 RepID=UPI00162575C8|nr:DUF4352 domain-containing protein [Listeria booriae]MBC2327823.1 hypothetical protein [Listeria booriae]